MIAFGPVPSRRLGRSLGINNIPPKVCSYACVYCQLGRAIKMDSERRPFYEPHTVFDSVLNKVAVSRSAGEPIDYIAFVPDGEPSLDINLGKEIELLRELEIKIAIITNASLVWREDVRRDLMSADWVSLKVDSLEEKRWRRIDRPHKHLRFESILEGMRIFAQEYQGELATETMLVQGFNDEPDDLCKIADFLVDLGPKCSYLSIPTRPPAMKGIKAPGEDGINRAYQIFHDIIGERVEYLIGYEGNDFACTGDAIQDLLSITSVHPMREDALDRYLERSNASWDDVRRLILENLMIETQYSGQKFFMRRLSEK